MNSTTIAATNVKINDPITINVATKRVDANIFLNCLNGPIRKQVLIKSKNKNECKIKLMLKIMGTQI